MKPEDFNNELKKQIAELRIFINDKLPRIAGKYAVDHFKDNFIKGGFVNNGLTKWAEPKRYNASGESAGEKYGTLLSARKELYNSINYEARNGVVIIYSDKEYAQIHNEGGETHPTVTDKMKRFAWSKHYATKKKDSFWKGIALTQKTHLNVKIPQRQFIGQSQELDNKIEKIIITNIDKIFS
jgi:phage gpG-like protein